MGNHIASYAASSYRKHKQVKEWEEFSQHGKLKEQPSEHL